jgi:plastocyanin
MVVVAAACGEDGVTDPDVPAVDSADVYMPAFSFSPFTTAVRAGGKVVFDFPSEPHNVIFASVQGAPADIQATRNRRISRTFAAAGEFPYDCTLHPGMSGVVVVTR